MKPNRTTPPHRRRDTGDETLHCRHFGTCGGCSLLDQPIAWQLHDKVEAAQTVLAPFLGDKRIEHTPPEHTPRWFRTRLLYPVRPNRKGQPSVGLFTFQTQDLVRIEECQTADPWLTAFGLAAERVIRTLGLVAFDPKTKKGHIKAVWARLASGTGEVLAGLVTRPGAFPQGADFATAITEAAADLPRAKRLRKLVGVVHSVSERDDDFLLGDRHSPLRGRDYIMDERDDLSFRISAGSFYQIHAGAYALLYRQALALCGDVKGLRVVDGYGGVGAFGLRLARAGAKSVTIVEDNVAACRDAEHNVAANRLTGVDVVQAPFGKSKFAAEPDLLIVDPPRSGLHKAGAARVLSARPRRVLHVACDAEALARDVATLTKGGYSLQRLHLCDLFPHTEHVELLALLERVD